MNEHQKNSVGIVETKVERIVTAEDPLKLQCGKTLGPIDVAYETYGQLDEKGENAILICHALSGNAHAAGYNSAEDTKPGWWDSMIGPGKGIDTNKYFVICSNFLGGCSGTTGPTSINPETSKPYGLDFPVFTIADMVQVQKNLLDKLGITQLLAVVGGSMGGMQVLQWSVKFSDFVKAAIVVASTAKLNAQSIAFDAVGRNAILADANFANGQYADREKGPDHGLSIARMIGHITYLSEESMRQKFGRELRSSEKYNYDFDSEFSVETYLSYQGRTFVERFDANSYLYITKAMDYFDLGEEYGTLQNAFENSSSRFLLLSITSDWLFTPAQSQEVVDALLACGKDVSYCNMESPYGHDSFLLESHTVGVLLGGFINSTYERLRSGNDTMVIESAPDSGKGAKTGRVDYELIDSLVAPNSKVLDVGCGDGELLVRLIADKNVKGEGLELDQDMIIHCIGRGLSVIHCDIETGLSQYATDSFDYAILSKTLQTITNTEKVFLELLRIAKEVIVSFPNFGHWRCRSQLMLKGYSPRTKQLPYRWHNSPNIHCLTIKDFDTFCQELGITVEKKIPLKGTKLKPVTFAPNIFADQAVYVTSKYQG